MIEDIQLKSQVVLNTLIKKDFQDAFHSWQKRLDWCLSSEEDYFEGDGGQ